MGGSTGILASAPGEPICLRTQDKDKMIAELKRSVEEQQRELSVHKVCVDVQRLASTVQLSPEVITMSVNGDETPDLIIQQVSLKVSVCERL